LFLAKVKEQFHIMDYIEKVLEKLKEWAGKLIEALLGPEAQPEPEPIPVPVRDPQRRR
jgi:predicted RNase H-like HicB family nuclease